MKELLSNEEIDTLLELFRAEGAELQEEEVHDLKDAVQDVVHDVLEGGGQTVSPVDLLKPNRFTSDQHGAAERFFSSMATTLAATMIDRLRLDLVCDCVAVEQLRFGDWQQRCGAPSAIYVLSTSNYDVPLLLTMSAPLLHGSVDRILGGRGRAEEPLPAPTEAMHTVAQSFVEPLVERLDSSLRELMNTEVRIERRVGNQALAQIVGPNDVVLSVYLQVSGEELHGDLRLVLPFAQAEVLLSRLGHGRTPDYDAAPGSMRGTVTRSMRGVALDLAAVLGGADLALRDLLELGAGDVLPLRRRVGEPVEVLVQGHRKFLASPGCRGRARALRIEHVEMDHERQQDPA